MLALVTPALVFLVMPVGSVYAAMPLIIPHQLRGQASALIFLSTSLGGLMMGPFLIGFCNDNVFRNPNLIGYSLALTVAIAATISVSIFRAAYRPYRRHYALLHP
jgi:MFS family permease